MIILALVLRRAARVVPREGFVGVVVMVGGGVHGGAGCAGGVVQGGVDGSLGTHALTVGA